MTKLKQQFVKFVVPFAVILLATPLAAEGPPNPCANACWQAYLNKVAGCHGDASCLGAARAEAEVCVEGCHLTTPR